MCLICLFSHKEVALILASWATSNWFLEDLSYCVNVHGWPPHLLGPASDKIGFTQLASELKQVYSS
jgi:hypothetical protein